MTPLKAMTLRPSLIGILLIVGTWRPGPARASFDLVHNVITNTEDGQILHAPLNPGPSHIGGVQSPSVPSYPTLPSSGNSEHFPTQIWSGEPCPSQYDHSDHYGGPSHIDPYTRSEYQMHQSTLPTGAETSSSFQANPPMGSHSTIPYIDPMFEPGPQDEEWRKPSAQLELGLEDLHLINWPMILNYQSHAQDGQQANEWMGNNLQLNQGFSPPDHHSATWPQVGYFNTHDPAAQQWGMPQRNSYQSSVPDGFTTPSPFPTGQLKRTNDDFLPPGPSSNIQHMLPKNEVGSPHEDWMRMPAQLDPGLQPDLIFWSNILHSCSHQSDGHQNYESMGSHPQLNQDFNLLDTHSTISHKMEDSDLYEPAGQQSVSEGANTSSLTEADQFTRTNDHTQNIHMPSTSSNFGHMVANFETAHPDMEWAQLHQHLQDPDYNWPMILNPDPHEPDGHQKDGSTGNNVQLDQGFPQPGPHSTTGPYMENHGLYEPAGQKGVHEATTTSSLTPVDQLKRTNDDSQNIATPSTSSKVPHMVPKPEPDNAEEDWMKIEAPTDPAPLNPQPINWSKIPNSHSHRPGGHQEKESTGNHVQLSQGSPQADPSSTIRLKTEDHGLHEPAGPKRGFIDLTATQAAPSRPLDQIETKPPALSKSLIGGPLNGHHHGQNMPKDSRNAHGSIQNSGGHPTSNFAPNTQRSLEKFKPRQKKVVKNIQRNTIDESQRGETTGESQKRPSIHESQKGKMIDEPQNSPGIGESRKKKRVKQSHPSTKPLQAVYAGSPFTLTRVEPKSADTVLNRQAGPMAKSASSKNPTVINRQAGTERKSAKTVVYMKREKMLN